MKTILRMVIMVAVATPALGTDQGPLYGTSFSAEIGSVAIRQADGTYEVFALSADSEQWAPPDEDERWPAYVARINADQGMPSGIWTPVMVRSDIRADEIAAQLNELSDDVVYRHYASWGYFNNGSEILRAVILVDEKIRLLPADFVFPPDEDGESIVLRNLWVVGYPLSDEAAEELMNRFVVPVANEGGGGGNFCIRGKNAGLPSFQIGRCDRQLAYGGLPRRPVSPSRTVDESDVGIVQNNPAGNVCLSNRTGCETICDNTLSTEYMSCESGLIGFTAGGGLTCLGLALVPIAGPGLALGCMGGTMVTTAAVTAACRETAFNNHFTCGDACRTAWQACCALPGTDCGTR